VGPRCTKIDENSPNCSKVVKVLLGCGQNWPAIYQNAPNCAKVHPTGQKYRPEVVKIAPNPKNTPKNPPKIGPQSTKKGVQVVENPLYEKCCFYGQRM
jgi:hypothetical protein